jgi:Leucine-rich repeat (LRR) protein
MFSQHGSCSLEVTLNISAKNINLGLITKLKNLQCPSLAENDISVSGGLYFSGAGWTSLRSLDVSRNWIGDYGAENFGEATCSLLENLNISSNNIRIDGAEREREPRVILF